MNKKALTVLTITAILMSILLAGSSFFIPSSDAPQVQMTLYDADGVKMVSTGETAEYVIKVENTGSTTGYIDLSKDGSADGWESSLSHEGVHLQPGDEQLISLYVTPVDEDADPSIEVNVIGTRGDNVTMVTTVTYIFGDVSILKSGETEWHTFDRSVDQLEEGDMLMSGWSSGAEFYFKYGVDLMIHSNTKIYIKLANKNDDNYTVHFELRQGWASFSVNLLSQGSSFTLDLANGGKVTTYFDSRARFSAFATGYVRVFDGLVRYNGPQTRQNDDEFINITQGMDSDGNTFDFGVLTYDNDVISGIIKNVNDETLGFNNEGNYVAEGNISSIVFKEDEKDIFYIYKNDFKSITIDIVTLKPGTFNLSFIRYDPELKGFIFKDVTTPSGGTATFKFKGDTVEIFSESRLDYDFEIHHKETDRFYLNDMMLFEGEGNSFTVDSYVFLKNDEVNSVTFGLDKDGDGTVDEDLRITTGLTGEEVYDDIGDDDAGSGYIVFAFALMIVLLIIGAYFILQMGTPEPLGGPGEDLEDETAQEEFLRDLEQSQKEEEQMEDRIEDEDDGPVSEESEKPTMWHPDGMVPIPMASDEPEPEPAPEDDLFRDGPEPGEDETHLPEEDDGSFGPDLDEKEADGEEPTPTIAEDLVERKRDMILEEDFEPIPEQETDAGMPEEVPIPIPVTKPPWEEGEPEADSLPEDEMQESAPAPKETAPWESEPDMDEFAPKPEPEMDEFAPQPEPDIDEFAPQPEPEMDEIESQPEPDMDEFAPQPEPDMDEFAPPPEPEMDEIDSRPEPDMDEFAPPPEPEMNEVDSRPEPDMDEFGPEEPDEEAPDLFEPSPDVPEMEEDIPITETPDESMAEPKEQEDLFTDQSEEVPPEVEEEMSEPEPTEEDEWGDGPDVDLDLFPDEKRIVLPPPPKRRRMPERKGPELTEDEDGVRRYGLNDIKNELQKVRELKYEMDTLEGTDSDNHWWMDWNDKVKKDIDSIGKEESD